MLREITAEQFFEWVAYHELHPFNSTFEDKRFALLAELIAAGVGVKLKGGGAFTSKTFLHLLHPDREQPPEPQQSVAQMEMYLNAWISGTNAVVAEEASLATPQRSVQ